MPDKEVPEHLLLLAPEQQIHLPEPGQPPQGAARQGCQSVQIWQDRGADRDQPDLPLPDLQPLHEIRFYEAGADCRDRVGEGVFGGVQQDLEFCDGDLRKEGGVSVL